MTRRRIDASHVIAYQDGGHRYLRDGVIGIDGNAIVHVGPAGSWPAPAVEAFWRGRPALAITIYDFDMSEGAEDHIWRHHITRDQVYEVLEHRWTTIPNRRGRTADYVVIGRDNRGRCIAIPVVPTDDPTIRAGPSPPGTANKPKPLNCGNAKEP